MAVLVEAISVVVRRSQIDLRYPGGWEGFVSDCPNQTLCADSDLARVGFMTPADVEDCCQRLETSGLTFQQDGEAIDFAVVDQVRGPTTRCEWLEFGHVKLDGNEIAACKMLGSEDMHVLTPDGWLYERSLSANYGFAPNDASKSGLVFLRHEDGLDVYFNRLTGEEVFIGRQSKDYEPGL